MEPEVKPEHTGWRDRGLSELHRKWGWNVPAVDVDFYIEYDNGTPSALVEYKRETAPRIDADHDRNTQAFVRLSNAAHIAMFGVRYSRDYSHWLVTPLNAKAKQWVTDAHLLLTQREYVRLLYRLRGYRELPPRLHFDEQGQRLLS